MGDKKHITIRMIVIIMMAMGFHADSFGSSCRIRGMNYVGWDDTAYSTDASSKSLDNLKYIGCDWVAINCFYFQDNIYSTTIELDYDRYSVEPNSVIDAIEYAHSIGLKVMLKPMVDCRDGNWRGWINPSYGWFYSYRTLLLDWAEIAEAYGVEMFCIGCEYATTNEPSSGDWSVYWKWVASSVRSVYSGPLTYAANPAEEINITWWDAMDYIGVNPYYPLTELTDPNEKQLQDAWLEKADDLEAWLLSTWPDKQIIFTEIGYRNYDGTNMTPWETVPHDLDKVDFQEQADCYKALLDQCRDRSWWRGVFWWNWETDPNAGLPEYAYTWHTPQNKPAETVLTNYYAHCSGFSRGDLNRDSWVDVNDLQLLSSQMLNKKQSIDLSPYPFGDGIINLRDFAVLAQNWNNNYKADINKDTLIDLNDVVVLSDRWMWTGTCGGIPEDIFEDGYVNIKDFAMIAEKWLTQLE